MSWGYRIAILTGSFVLFMTAMVISAFRQNFDLVTEDYYGRELVFQQQIDKQQNQSTLTTEFTYVVNDSMVSVIFPDELKGQKIVGKMLFFRPSDAKKDLLIDIELKDGVQNFSKELFSPGMYKLQIDYETSTKKYFEEKQIMIP
jgi:hypothetical protein